ncbi:hypothetical protein TrispH2_001850 [Trichoplax sp. H2]|nr:hypothetical protein TrispH2_001850 [Trichoplax sp. H2]|eukprot:RDD45958.1 hypothetical protein TrispH2_001850 [Trichoplax sp. H2]
MAEIDDDSDVPPLEDMSDLIGKVQAMRTETSQEVSYNTVDSNYPSGQSAITDTKHEETTQYKASNESTAKKNNLTQSSQFGGFKSGFLNSKPAKVKSHGKVEKKGGKGAKEDDLEFVKPKKSKEDELKFQEVQDAINQSHPLLKNNDWVTNDLLTKIQANPRMHKQISDPRFVAALKKFETDREGAMKQFQGDPELQQFFTDFCQLMGNHFLNISKDKDPSKSDQNEAAAATENRLTPKKLSPEDIRAQQIVSDPKIAKILNNSEVKEFIELLKRNPEAAQQYLFTAPKELREKLQKLVECGVLSVQRS